MTRSLAQSEASHQPARGVVTALLVIVATDQPTDDVCLLGVRPEMEDSRCRVSRRANES
jgi:hypothetical protein